MGVPSRTSAPTPALDQTFDIQIILGKVRPFLRRLAEAHPQVLIIAHGWGLSTPKTWWLFVVGAVLFGYPAYDFASQRYPYLILGLYIAFMLSVGARFGYVDRLLDHSFAARQYVQFALVSILTLGLFPAGYLTMYFGGQHWITKTEAYERHSRARASREQT